jgi:hypothetical protein
MTTPPAGRAAHAASLLLALHACTLVALCWQQKLTPDEANYVLAGCILRHELSWDAYNTVLHGPLAFWPNQLGVLVADPADLTAYAPWGRLGFVPFTFLAAVAVWRLARGAFGARAGLAALVVWATNPLVLAHGCLMTADMALACGTVWTAERAFRYLTAPSWRRLLLLGSVLGLTLATKYLALLLLPALALVLALALAQGFAPRLLWSRRRATAAARLADAALAVAVVAVVGLLVLHSTYLWRVQGFRAAPPLAAAEAAAEDPEAGPRSGALRAVALTPPGRFALQLLPEPWVRGIDYQRVVSQGLPTWFGDRVADGFWSYYAVGFALKLPLLSLLLFGVGLLVRRPAWPPWLGLVAGCLAGVPLLFLSGITRLQIGIRYALPALPFFCLVAGRGLGRVASAPSAALRLLGCAAGLALIAGAAAAWPRYLTAFNALAPRPYLWFRDSTLDWRAAAPDADADLALLRARHPGGRVIQGSLGPCFGKLLVHGDQLAPRDPRDPGRIYHWLRRFWPVDAVGAWFAFAVDEAAFRGAVEADRDHRARGRVDLAIALLGAGDVERAAAELRGSGDPAAEDVAAAAVELRSGDGPRAAAALLRLGRHDLVLDRPDVPRALRAQALLMAGKPRAVVELLEFYGVDLEGNEPYLLASALAAVGRGHDALTLLEARRPAEPAAAAVHDQVVRRLREMLRATALADQGYLRR